MIRKRRKIRTMRGSRTCGGGNPKKRRGAGHRGGRGLAGGGKNKKTKADFVRIHFPGHLGRRGFKRPQKVLQNEDTINLEELDQRIPSYLEEGIARKKGDFIVVDLNPTGITKVLGKGKITHKLEVSAPHFSESAVRKIESAGGKAHGTG